MDRTSPRAAASPDTLQAWIVGWLGDHLATPPAAIALDARFRDLGLSSALATQLVAALARELDRPLPLTLVWDHPTVAELVRRLTTAKVAAASAPVREAPRPVVADREIAVVAMACRFPGGAHNPAAFWDLLARGHDAVGPVPADRFDAEACYDRDPAARGKAVTRWGGFLDATDTFDPMFFGISPREAIEMDPQQRLMLELAWEAFEDAGLPRPALRDRGVGVFLGAMWNDYARLWRGGPRAIDQFTATGQDDSIIAARISYVFGLRGPSLTVNTACSSSLVAVHLACQSLVSGDSELALAGGVNLIFGPDSTIAMSKFGGMARDGKCKAFDARGDGYVRGEGAAVVLLKPAARAREDGDRIHAIIRGSAINNDGYSNGLTAPSQAAQAAMLRAAYASAGVSPGQVHYVEAHGTGTMLGDPIEAGALGEVLGRHPDRRRALRIGSAKTNIGHLEAAAGMAGLIKTIEALKHRRLPASLHFEQPNPNIDFAELGLEVQATASAWPATDDELIAGVSSFGFGGTNAHVVVAAAHPARPLVIPVAAGDRDALARQAGALAAFVDANPAASLDDIQRSWIAASDPGAPARRAVVVASHSELVDQLASPAAPPPERSIDGARPVFVFTGNGAQWPGMARDLMADPVFCHAVSRCDQLLRSLGCDGVAPALRDGRFDPGRVDLVQPLLWAVQVGLVERWRAWGVEPAAVVGHSVGEIAAAWAAGAISLGDAARVVVHRSRLQQTCADRGGMVMLETDAAGARDIVAAAAADDLAIAACNSRRSTVVSGPLASLQAAIACAAERGITSRSVRINVAYHGPQMDPLRAPLGDALAGVAGQAPQLAMISSVTGAPVTAPLDAAYWVRNMADPVAFGAAIDYLVRDGRRCFLEIGPHPTLSRAVEDALSDTAAPGLVAPSLERERPGRARLLASLAALYERGAEIAWTALCSDAAAQLAVPGSSPPPRAGDRAELIAVSGHNDAALRARLAGLLQHLQDHPGTELAALARTLGRGRNHLAQRCAIVAASTDELAGVLAAARDTGQAPGLITAAAVTPPARIAFVFPGQGSQWLGMGRQLLASEPVFRASIEHWERVLAEFTDWSLLAELRADPQASRLGEVDVIQPALFAMQVALAALWRSWGVHPDAVIGHSMGEVAAASVAGALSDRDAARVICTRSRIARTTSGRGAMAMVELSLDDCRRAIAGHAAVVSIAACNGPTSCVLSGDAGALEAITARLQADGVFVRPIKVDYASHSPQMDAIKGELARALADTRPAPPAIALHSTVDDAVIDDARMDAAYWARNLREPVLFCQGIQQLEARGHNVFLEISPHPVLTYAITRTVRSERAVIAGSLRRDEDERRALLASLGAVFAAHGPVDWAALLPGVTPPIALPSYPFQRERCWFTVPDGAAAPAATGAHGLLDRLIRAPFPHERLIWDTEVSLERFPYLADHQVSGIPVFPGTGYLECVLEAARDLHGDAAVELTQVAFEKALLLEGTGARTLQLSMEPDGPGHRFTLASHDPQRAVWTQHVTGVIAPATRPRDHGADPRDAIDPAAEAGDPSVDVAAFYRNLDRAGNTYGPRFQAVQRLRHSGDRARGEVALGDGLSTRGLRTSGGAAPGSPRDPVIDSPGLRIHPVLLDACLQVMATPIAMGQLAGDRESAFMPTRIDRIRVFHDAGTAAVSQVKFHDRSTADRAAGDLHADIDVTDPDGRLVVRLERVCFHLLEHARAAPRPIGDLVYRLAWHDAAPVAPPATAARRWLVFDDGSLGDRIAALLPAPHAVHRIRPGAGFRRAGDDFEIRPGELEDHRAVIRALPARDPLPLGVLHLWNLALPDGDATDLAALRDAAERGCLSLGHLVNALTDRPGTPPRVWIATRGAQAASGDDIAPACAPAHAPAWGFSRALAQEHPSLWGGIVDLDPRDDPGAQAAQLIAEASAAQRDEDRLAYRQGRRRAVRMVRAPELAAGAAPGLRGDRGYLITGGLGALGLGLATWLAGHGARHLVLLGRQPLPARRTWTQPGHAPAVRARIDAVLAIERLGAHVLTAAVDVGDQAALRRFLDDYDQEARPALAGVAHLAGAIRPEPISALGAAGFDEAFRGKVHGAWHLHRALAGRPLDFFVLFASASAVLDSPLLGSYAAANAFLDALAQLRRARGLPAQAIDWGFWAEAGMAAAGLGFGASPAASQSGMRSFAPATGLELLGKLLAHDPVQAIVLDVDWPVWLASYPEAAASPVLRVLRGDLATAAPAASAGAAHHLRTLPPDALPGAVNDLLITELGAVLKLPAARIVPTARFGTMGLDSMLSLELRNRLERRTGLVLPGTLAWNYPTLERMAAFLVDKLGEDRAAGATPPATTAPASGELALEPSDEMIEILRQLGVISDDDPVLRNPEALRNLVRDTAALLGA